MAAAVAAQGLRNGRRRIALNEALHELRRPLQAVALADRVADGRARRGRGPDASWPPRRWSGSTAEINGGHARRPCGAGSKRGSLTAGCRRALARPGRARRRLAGAALECRRGDRRRRPLRARAGDRQPDRQRDRARRPDDRRRRHGAAKAGCGSPSRTRAAPRGRGSRRGGRREGGRSLSGRRRHGHGLAVVRRVAAAHGGRFALAGRQRGSLAVIELPLADEPIAGWAA